MSKKKKIAKKIKQVMKKHHEKKKEIEIKKENSSLPEAYSIEVDKAKVRIEIKRGALGITYFLYVPEIGIATASLLNEIRNELVSVTTISMKEILDPNAFNDIKKRFMDRASSILKTRMPNIEPGKQEFLVGKLMQDMLGLGEIEFLVNDPSLEEVVIPSAKEQIRV